jgi:HK97 family phage major capsid protein
VAAEVKPTTVVRIMEKKAMAKKSISDQIAAFEATRGAKAARMEEIMLETGDKGETLDQAGTDEYDGLQKEVGLVDDHLTRLRVLEKMNLARAVPVNGGSQEDATKSRAPTNGAHSIIQVRQPKLEPGIPFTRYVLALARSQGNLMQALEIAKSNEQWMAETPLVADVLRAAVAAGTSTDSAWAGPLVNYQILTTEFAEFLRPQTIIGNIPGLTRVPFKVKVPLQSGGSTVGWVGEGKPKPVSALAFATIVLDIAKIAGIIALTDELVRLSNPSAELLVRNDLAASIVQLMDRDFVDPTKASTAVSPASITNGITGVTATGTDAAALRKDLGTMIASFLGNNLGVGSAVLIMTQQQAMQIGLMLNTLGQPYFPGMSMTGGSLLGIPVVASENIPAAGGVPANGYPIILALAREILMADDGTTVIDASREASLQMDGAPDSPPTATTVLVSLWQNNMVAIKAERFINWKRRRDTAVAFITGGKYAA